MANDKVYMTHTFRLNEPKENIRKYIKGINATTELANYFNYLTQKEVPIKDIGIMLKNKCPFIVNYDFSKEALMNKRPIFLSVKEIDEDEEMILKIYLDKLLDDKVRPLEKKLSNYDKEIIKGLKEAFRDVQLTTTDIPEEVLNSDFEVSVLWGAYASYLLTQTDIDTEIVISKPLTKHSLLKELEKFNKSGEVTDEEMEMLKQEGEWEDKYVQLVKPEGYTSYEYGHVGKKKDYLNKYGYTFYKEKSCNTQFRLKNNGSQIGCMSDVLMTGEKPFSLNVNLFFEHTLSDEYEGCFIVNQSTTGWVNSEEQVELNTTDKSSLYICSSKKRNNYVRLEIENKVVEDKEGVDKKNKIASNLVDSDKVVFENLLGSSIDLESILMNPRKYVQGRLENNLAFAGIPIAAPLKSKISDHAQSGLSMRDRLLFYNLIFEKLKEQGLNIEKEEYLKGVSIANDLKSDIGFNASYVQMNKAQHLNENIERYIMAYWGKEEHFNDFINFAENLKTEKTGGELILKKISENEYEMNMSEKSLRIKFMHCNVGTMADLIRPMQGDSLSNKDIEINSLLFGEHIKSEFKRHGIDVLKKPKNMIISNIVEIPPYHTNLSEKWFDPCYTLRVAFALLGLNIQVINELKNIEDKRRYRKEEAEKLSKILAESQTYLEELKSSTSIIDKENLSKHNADIKNARAKVKEDKDNLDKAIKRIKKGHEKDEKDKKEVFKSCLLDCFSKKGITARLETEKLHNGTLAVFSFAIVEMANEKHIYLLTKYTKDGLFIKDISDSKNGKILNEWVRMEDFTAIVNRYVGNGKNNKLEEHVLWARIEREINEVNAEENILLIAASERKLLKDLTNSKITKGIRILNEVKSLTLVRINDFNDAPYGAVYEIVEEDGKEVLYPTTTQGLFKKNEYIYYSKSGRGSTMQETCKLTSTKFDENEMLNARKSIEFCIVSNHLESNDSVASMVHALRRLTIAFEVATNKPYTLHIVEKLAEEYKK